MSDEYDQWGRPLLPMSAWPFPSEVARRAKEAADRAEVQASYDAADPERRRALKHWNPWLVGTP